MATELASGFIRLTVQYGSAMSKIARDFDVLEAAAKKSGKKAGENVSDGIDSGSSDAGRRVASNVEDGLDRSTAERIGSRFGNFLSNAIRRETKKSGKDLANDFQGSGMVKAARSFTVFSAAAGGAAVALGSLGPASVAAVAALGAVAAAAGGAAVAGLSAMGVAVASIKVATIGLADTFKVAFDPTKVEDFNKAMAKLGPQTQAMVKGVVGLVQAWKDSGAQIAVQDALFADLGGRFGALKQFIEPVKTAMVAVNSAFNSAIKSVLDFVNSAQGVTLLTGWLTDSSTIVKNFAAGIGNIVPGLMAIGAAATQAFAPLTGGIGDAAKRFSDLMLSLQKSGELQAFFLKMWDIAKQVGNALKQLVGVFAAVGSAAAAAGGGNGLALITDKLQTLNAFFSAGAGREALITFFKSAQAAMGAILPVILEVAKVIGSTLAPIIANIATNVAPALIPAIQAIGDGIGRAAPQFESIANAIKGFIELITPALPILVQFAPAILLIVGAIKAWAVITAAYTALQWLLNAALTANPIGIVVVAIAALVAGLVLLFNKNKGFHDFVVGAWEGIKTAFTAAWGVVKPVLDALGTAVMWLWNTVIVPAFNGIKAAISVWWSYAQGVFAVIKTAFSAVGDVFGVVFNDFILPMWHNFQTLMSVAWSVIEPIWEAMKIAFAAVGAVFGTIWDSVISPAWEAIKTGFKAGWDFLSGIFDTMKDGFQKVADFIGGVWNGISGAVKSALDAVVSVMRGPIHTIGNLIMGIPTSVLGVEIPGVQTAHALGAKLQAFSTGSNGVVSGPGNGTSDSILAWLSNGEGVVTAAAMAKGGAPLVAALNAGWTPSAAMISSMVGSIPGFAEGLSPGADFLRNEIMQLWPQITTIGGKRSEDGFGEHSSGNAIDVMIPGYDTPQGKALGDSVASFIAKNSDALGADGFIWRQTSFGYGGSFTEGKQMPDRGSDTQNHMDHVHIILGKGRGEGAPQVDVPTATLSLPSGGSVSPGSGASSSGGAATPKQLQTAQDKITDLQNKVDTSQMQLDEAQKNPKTSPSALKSKKDAVEKNKRELDQAKQDLETLKAKTDDGKGGKSGSDDSNPFSQIGKGIGQLADLAKGGLKETFLPPGFSDPEGWGITKAIGTLLGFGGGIATGMSNKIKSTDPNSPQAQALGVAGSILGAGGQIAGGQTGGGISALFDLIPKPKKNADGTPVDPGAANAVAPGQALPDQPHDGTGAVPGPESPMSANPDPTAGGGGGGTTNVDNSTHIAEGGQINANATQVMEAANRQQVAAQTPQLGTRRFV